MLFDLLKLVKSSIFFVIFLFVIKAGYKSTFITFGRLIFISAVVITIISMILKWFTHKYELDDLSFHFYKGIFRKSERTIPFSKIQNVKRHASLFHRIFKVTSISFETGITGEDATVKFEVISLKEADRIVHSTSADRDELVTITTNQKPNRTIHFKPTRKGILVASFSSLSFLLLIPLIGSFYFKMNEIFHVEEEAEGILSKLLSSWWMVTLLIIVVVFASAMFGITRTFLKYGKYEIASDQDRIYITKGIIEETAFSISKEKVQAIEIKQSIIKRYLGLAEVKLTSVGTMSSGEDLLDINSLYPFLPIKRAYGIISDILPAYEVTERMNRLPRTSLWMRMFKPSWLGLIASGLLFYFNPTVLGVEQAWWIPSLGLFIIIYVLRCLDFLNTRYILNDNFIQIKKGSLTTSLFISRRDKVIEVKVSRNIFQKLLGLATIGTINRAKPVKHAGVDDVPLVLADSFYKWYMWRRNEIEIEINTKL
jgi:putative membrane protein